MRSASIHDPCAVIHANGAWQDARPRILSGTDARMWRATLPCQDRRQCVDGELPMNITLWVLQILLAVAFFAHGWMLLFPPANLIEQMNAVMSTEFRIFLGI